MILAFGTYDAARHPRAGILVEGLRAQGAEVVEANRPLGFSTAERVRMLRQPWRLPALAVRLARCWTGLARDARRVRREHGRPDALLVGYLGHFDVLLARALFPRTTVVLDHLVFAGDTATDRGARGLRVRLLDTLDRAALACADVAVVDTDEHAALLPRPERGVVVPVGARREWFEAGAAHPRGDAGPGFDASSAGRVSGRGADAPDPALSIVFFGLFTPLQGAVVIAHALATLLDDLPAGHRGVQVTMVGSGQDWQAARDALGERPGVTWVPWVEPADLPGLVAAHDVCLGIFADTPKALRVVPNKVYEGLAAGCAVVTSDTAPQRRVLGDAAVLVPPADPDALAAALRDLADDPARLRAAQAAAREAAGRLDAEHVVAPLARRLGVGA